MYIAELVTMAVNVTGIINIRNIMAVNILEVHIRHLQGDK